MTKREKELEDLFQRWMKKQGEEKGWEKTTVGGREILRIHFTKDGMVDPEAYEVSSCKILVVLKEANIADNKTEEWLKEHMIDDQRYWYREFVNGTIHEVVWTDENGCRKKSDNIPQKESIGRMAYLLQKYTKNQKIDANRPSGKEIQDAVKQVAFMNLNKRGGSQKVNEKVLNDYVEEYKNEIKEEIEILQPDYIIWCAGEKPMGKILEKKNGIEMLHPAAGRYIYRNNEELGFEFMKYGKLEDGTLVSYSHYCVSYMLEEFPRPWWWSRVGEPIFGEWSVKKGILICDVGNIDRALFQGEIDSGNGNLTSAFLRFIGRKVHLWLLENPTMDEDDELMEMGEDSIY